MESLRSGDGQYLVVSRATYRERTGPLRLPLPVQFATREAIASLGEAFADHDSLRRTPPTGVPGEPVPSWPSVSLDGSPDRSRASPGEDGPGQTRGADAMDGDPSFVVGLHAATVGDGDPTSLESLVGTRALPPGHYRDVPVPIWSGNPFPIVPPDSPGERPRTHWTDVELPPERGGHTDIEITAALWDGRGSGAREPLTPVANGWGLPATSTATVSFGRGAEPDGPELAVGGDARGR